MPRIVSLFVTFAAFISIACGQSDPQAILKAYKAERADAFTRFPAEALAAADAVVAKAEAAMVANPTLAARLLRDARWQLPYVPPGLPPHVTLLEVVGAWIRSIFARQLRDMKKVPRKPEFESHPYESRPQSHSHHEPATIQS